MSLYSKLQLLQENIIEEILTEVHNKIYSKYQDKISSSELNDILLDIKNNCMSSTLEEGTDTCNMPDTDRCIHIFKRGKREGKRCEKKKEDIDLCKRHMPHGCQHVLIKGDRKGKKCKGIISKSSEQKKYCLKHLAVYETPKFIKIKDTEYLLHPKSNFVFKSNVQIIEDDKTKKVKVVIGRKPQDTISPLTESDFLDIYHLRFRVSPEYTELYQIWYQTNQNTLD